VMRFWGRRGNVSKPAGSMHGHRIPFALSICISRRSMHRIPHRRLWRSSCGRRIGRNPSAISSSIVDGAGS